MTAEGRKQNVQDDMRVVLVDDIAETREHLSKLLSFESDIEVVGTAGSGLEALQVAAAVKPDVLLMDINMPGMDGIATAEELATRVPTTAIVMMSVQGEAPVTKDIVRLAQAVRGEETAPEAVEAVAKTPCRESIFARR